MILHQEISNRDLAQKIKQSEILFGGNKNLKIYGTLSCTSGKRMKRKNRVFFSSKIEAVENGYHPCKRCMKTSKLNDKNKGLF